MTPDDVVKILDLFDRYDSLTVTRKRSEDSIKLQRQEDGITYVAIIGKKKGHIFTKNVWKTDKKIDGSLRRTNVTKTPASTSETAAQSEPSDT